MNLLAMTIIVAKVAFSSPAPSFEEIDAKFESESIEWNAIDKINWESHTWKPDVSFRIMHSDTEIYIQYKVKQDCVRAVYSYDTDSRPYTDDCVEFFCIPSDTDPSYYNLELNCIGHGTFHWGPTRAERHRNDGIIDMVRRRSSLGSSAVEIDRPTEWTMTVAIPKEAFKQADKDLKDFSGRTVRANFYKCGDNTKTPHYLSWNPIGTPKPQFHAPDYFGELKFE